MIIYAVKSDDSVYFTNRIKRFYSKSSWPSMTIDEFGKLFGYSMQEELKKREKLKLYIGLIAGGEIR